MPNTTEKIYVHVLALDVQFAFSATGCSLLVFARDIGRLEDLNLVATGIRSAVLLDSRHAPRGSPPLANVLRALQDSRRCKARSTSNSDGCCIDDISSLGLLALDGSNFLVNRRLLRSRLAEVLAPCTPTTHTLSSTTKHSEGVDIANVMGSDGNHSGSWHSKTLPKAEKISSPAKDSGDGITVPTDRDFALVDVRDSVRVPRLCTELLAPRLVAVLWSVFGNINAADASIGAIVNPPVTQRQADAATSALPTNSSSQGMSEGEDSRESGERWVLNWGRVELTLEVGDNLLMALGDVGMPGLAGWLLEYPVIYCCPSMIHGNDQVPPGTPTFSEGVPGNCLAMVQLSVYSVDMEFGNEIAPTSSNDCKVFKAFSFSIPDRVCAGTDSDRSGAITVPDYLLGLVDKFTSRMQGRIARCVSNSCCQCRQALPTGLNVRRRIEVLDRVAL